MNTFLPKEKLGMNAKLNPAMDAALQDRFISEITASRKYRELGLPREMLEALFEQESQRYRKPEEVLQSVRKKLHTMVAVYLGDADYAALQPAFAAAAGNRPALKELCLQALTAHASTRERLGYQAEMYQALWQKIGKPQSLLDLACGLNPFAFPWMSLPDTTRYLAYDFHQPRVELINTFFAAWGMAGKAFQQDILLHPSAERADAALFFKEAHRFEERQKGCNRGFWQKLNVRTLLVSLPVRNLTGSRSILSRQRQLMERTLAGLNWPMEGMIFENEVVFILWPTRNGDGA